MGSSHSVGLQAEEHPWKALKESGSHSGANLTFFNPCVVSCSIMHPLFKNIQLFAVKVGNLLLALEDTTILFYAPPDRPIGIPV